MVVVFATMLLGGFLWPPNNQSASAEIQVDYTMHAISVNSNSGKLYFANDNGSVSVVDKDEIIQIWLPGSDDLEIEYFRSSVAINEITNKIYASSSAGEVLVVIDGDTDKIAKEISLDQFMNVFSIAVDPVTNRIYAATYSFIYVIDGSTDEIVDRIDIGDHTVMGGDVGSLSPAELSVNPVTHLIYATNKGSDLIAVIDGSANLVVANITVPSPFSAVINPKTNKLYVTFQSSEYLAVYNGAHPYERLAIIEDVDTQSFDNNQIAIDAARNRVYVVAYPEDGVTIIDGNLDRKFETVATHYRPVALGANSDTGIVYVGMDGFSIVDEMEYSETPPPMTDSLEIQTDKKAYSLDENITITGRVPGLKNSNINETQNVAILEFGNLRDGYAYFVDVAPLSQDGSFSYQIEAQQLRSTSLTHTVRAVYGCNAPAEAWFNLTATYERPATPGAEWKSMRALIAGEEYSVNYAMTGGTLLGIADDIELATITLTLDTDSDGEILIELPNGANDVLGVFPLAFIDSIPGEPEVLHLGEDLTAVRVAFERGTAEIELVGSVPFTDVEPSLRLPPTEQFLKRFTTKHYASVSGEDFFIWLEISGADYCKISFSQENKNLQVELTGKGTNDGVLSVYLPKKLFSGNFSIFIDGKEQQNTYVQKEAAGNTYGGKTNDFTMVQQRFNWSNPETTDTISVDVYASRVLPEFSPLSVAILLTTSITGLIIVTRSMVGALGRDRH